jgi:hypothetical protein
MRSASAIISGARVPSVKDPILESHKRGRSSSHLSEVVREERMAFDLGEVHYYFA